MNKFEVLSHCLTLLALTISVTGMIRSREMSSKLIKLELKQAELADAQLKKMKIEQHEAEMADIDVNLVPENDGWSLYIENIGKAPARDVHIEWVGEPPRMPQDQGVLPISLLQPSKKRKLIAAHYLDSVSSHEGVAKWKDRRGVIHNKEICVHYS